MAIPLAEKLRPTSIDDFVGQEHLLGEGKAIRKMLEQGKISSMIFWGPPGCGKTTLAKLIAKHVEADFISFSAVTGKISQVRQIIENTKKTGALLNRDLILFVDEIHRFNKAQQDAFLPYVEDGTIILIGATTENPGFSVIAPLLSRARVYTLKALSHEDLMTILLRARKQFKDKSISTVALEHFAGYANGDARNALNALEVAFSLSNKVDLKAAEQAIQKKAIYYDKHGEEHFNTISAFIKSMRGGDADAALHYLARMLKAGEDPMFIARRMVIFASEDVGNASPAALILATSCMQAVHMIGMPEAGLLLAQTATYLATAPKSIASTLGLMQAINDVETQNLDPIPLHLRNSTNLIAEQLGYGKGHVRYPWKELKKRSKEIKQDYLPKNLLGKKYYEPDWSKTKKTKEQ